jgi:hypothetical protein
MIELILNFVPAWLGLSKSPMSLRARQLWGKARKLGFGLFTLLFTFGLGGLCALLDIAWDAFVDHQAMNGPRIFYQGVWWLVGGLVVAIGEWHLNERRFRLPPKSASALEDSKLRSRIWAPQQGISLQNRK